MGKSLEFQTIQECRGCGAPHPDEFFNLGNLPPANSLRKSLNEKLPEVPLRLAYCEKCSLIQLMETIDPKYLFNHYVWVTGTSQVAQEYAKTFCDRVTQRAGRSLSPEFSVLELASNDGTFLKVFQDRGAKVLGIDPAQNVAEAANQAGIPTKAAFFNTAVAKETTAELGAFDVVFARNVLPHVADLHGFAEGMAKAAKDDGMVAVEFHYAKTIFDELHYDSIYHEHLCYFTLKPVEHLFKQYGLHGFDLTRSPISGGSLVLYLSKTPRKPSAELEAVRRDEAATMNSRAVCDQFVAACEKHKKQLNDIVHRFKKSGKKMIGYGASARSATLLGYCQIGNEDLSCVADKSDYKHQLYQPGSNLLIVPPKEALAARPDAVLLLAWNFTDELLKTLKTEFGFKGQVILPLPGDPRVVEIGN